VLNTELKSSSNVLSETNSTAKEVHAVRTTFDVNLWLVSWRVEFLKAQVSFGKFHRPERNRCARVNPVRVRVNGGTKQGHDSPLRLPLWHHRAHGNRRFR
jgi:hypothetical protein